MSRNLTISFNANAEKQSQQNISFFYAFTSGGYSPDNKPTKYSNYEEIIEKYPHDALAVLNFVDTDKCNKDQGLTTLNIVPYASTSIYKREIWYTGTNKSGESVYRPVAIDSNEAILYDYNVGNKRYYQYLFYFGYQTDSGTIQQLPAYKSTLRVGWEGWTITELHPDIDDPKKYYAYPKDVWKFRYNLSPGQQTQNISKTQQDTLAAFPRFSHGPKNAISGSVSGLLGNDIVPACYSNKRWDYVKNDVTKKWSWVETTTDRYRDIGGYQEKLDESRGYADMTSNKSIDMLDAWRDLCYSGNPKLLKDPVGQTMLVQITSANNTSNESWNKQPQTISFDWMQIGDAKEVQIIGPAD